MKARTPRSNGAPSDERLEVYRSKVRSSKLRAERIPSGSSDTAATTSRGEKRRARLIQAASREFLEKGFEGASLREIVRRAGGSSDTLYQHFGDKSGLFIACAADLCSRFMVAYTLDEDDHTIERQLSLFGLAYLRDLLSASSLAVYRMMIAESPKFPGLGKLMLERGYFRVLGVLTRYLQHQSDMGVLEIDDPDLAARQFVAMIRAGMHDRALLKISPIPSAAEMRASAETAARVFCAGYAPAGSASRS